eukprot:TRINITY_DN8123_c0_g1_i1.p1 TRINITY_DN8123_c0_g1~~TRINITY_DN8123_c0_g1_i1.p1  ORF type:complete len:104 (-),score=5.04 TRINITY_DN8123_c0_g1_i1:2215-2526(-)
MLFPVRNYNRSSQNISCKGMARTEGHHASLKFLRAIWLLSKIHFRIFQLAASLTNLTKSTSTFNFNDKCKEAFIRLKLLLTTTPILEIADMNKPFTVITDAST